ncbi:MAG: type II secretion system F family protein [Candidatus Aenigmatarchaeota archaeon]
MKFEEILIILILIFLGIFIFFLNNFLLSKIFKNIIIQISLNVLAIFIPLINIFLIFNEKHRKRKEMEFFFSIFLRDLAENIRSGRNIISSLENLKDFDYKSLSPLIKKMYSEVKLGIPFDKALNNLARRSESKLIKKISITIGEALKAGGDVNTTIEAVIRSIIETEKVRREREMIAAPTKINGFMIYFMFLIIMIILIKFLLPAVQQSQQLAINIQEIKEILIHLILIQSFFSGMLIGKMSEGSIIPGLRYSIILMLIGYVVFSISI